MFPLHDRTRRRVAVTVFGATCLLPTLLILLWGLSRQMPWRADAESRRLETVLGLRVRIERVQNVKPGVCRYEGFALHDPETGHRLLHCEQLEVHDAGRGWVAAPTLTLRARNCVADADGATALRQVLARFMQGHHGRAPLNVQWSADELSFGDDLPSLAELSGEMQAQPHGVIAQVRFRPAEVPATEPAHVEVHRNRSTSPARMEVKLYTGGASLPCRLLATAMPAFRTLGPQSRFRGYVRAEHAAKGWNGELTGHFSDVDLGRLVRDRFGQPLDGTGRVSIERACFGGGRVEEAWGAVWVGPGTIGRGLLNAMVGQLSLVQNVPPPKGDDPVPFRQLAATWHVDADGLRIEGRCAAAGPRTLLAGVEPWRVAEPIVQPLPAAALVRALAPSLPAEVPATPESAWLLRYLPLPEARLESAAQPSAEPLR